jgi:hypothetical protein
LQQRRRFHLDEKNIIAEDYKVLNVNIRKKSAHGLTFVMDSVYCIPKTNQTCLVLLVSAVLWLINLLAAAERTKGLKLDFCVSDKPNQHLSRTYHASQLRSDRQS